MYPSFSFIWLHRIIKANNWSYIVLYNTFPSDLDLDLDLLN